MKLPFQSWLGLAAFVLLVGGVVSAAEAGSEERFKLPAEETIPGAGPFRRADWFQRVWMERRSRWATETQRDQGALVFLGDSITQGFGEAGSLFSGVKIANRGIGGDTTRGVLYRLSEDVLSVNPKGVVLLIGTNDLEDNAAPEVIAANVKQIVAELKKHNPRLPIVLCAVFPSSASKRRPADQIRKLNAVYRQTFENEPQVTMLDTYSLFADAQGDAPIAEFPDLLHPNGSGNHHWAMALRPMLESLDLIPAWPDDFVAESGFKSLFNGHDLGGWTYEGGDGTLEGKLATADGRYRVANGRLIVTPSRKDRDYKKLWTAEKFPRDFVLKLEFRASPNADSGVYIREPQLQCRDYLTAGPFYRLKSYRPLEWNELVVTVRGGLAHATCNGEVLIDAMPVPETGPIGLESDRGQMEYRRIRLQEQPR